MQKLSVIDYGAGNLGSVLRALHAIGVKTEVVTSPQGLAKAGATIFPGVGAAGQAMRSLQKSGLDKEIINHVQNGKPLLGICVGMQVLGEYSEEDNQECLGVLPFHLKKFKVPDPVPHMGWNAIEFATSAHPMFAGLQTNVDVYFVHSYFAPSNEKSASCASAFTNYAGVNFVSAVARGSVWGMQFHVEKSGKVGLNLLQNFVNTFCEG